jgi:dTDP-4-amino-4,6-dideoxygalactose transaminase
MIGECEAALRYRLGVPHPVTVNSGTSTLHLAPSVAGVVPGHEVVLPAMTFVATGLVILMPGAVPILADIAP